MMMIDLCKVCVFGSGFLVSPFLERVGYIRIHAIFCLVGATGLAVSAFVTNIYAFIFSFGAIAGWC